MAKPENPGRDFGPLASHQNRLESTYALILLGFRRLASRLWL